VYIYIYPFILYLNSSLLAPFYTLSFLDHTYSTYNIYIYIYYIYIYVYIYIYIYTHTHTHTHTHTVLSARSPGKSSRRWARRKVENKLRKRRGGVCKSRASARPSRNKGNQLQSASSKEMEEAPHSPHAQMLHFLPLPPLDPPLPLLLL
jgi:hypothetical protein